MGKRSHHISADQQAFIEAQPIFFVGTARAEGRVNISPKGLDSLRVMNPNRVVWLNLTGSGNETAAHLLEENRMTLLFCAFEGKPKILRLYGHAKVYHQRDPEFQDLIQLFPSSPGHRQLLDMEVDLIQTSCGFGIPIMTYQGNRTMLPDWAAHKGKDGIQAYWKEKNTTSLDGFQTGIFE